MPTKPKILQRDDPVLRKKASEVALKDITSKKIKDVIYKMKEALHGEEDGVAIAAPQIGESLRIFVVNGSVFDSEDMVFINPDIIKTSRKKNRMEEGCLSVRYLYGLVERSEKITITAHDENGRRFQRGASGLMSQIFQHETDHLDGVLFTDKAENLQDIPPNQSKARFGASTLKFVFFGSSAFSKHVLDELKRQNFYPVKVISSAKTPLPSKEALSKLEADVFVIASFGKILPKEIIELPKYGSLNVHPSLLPELRGASPIQNTILGRGRTGVTIMKMDEKVDHGPIVAQAEVKISPWPDHYETVEKKLGQAGGAVLASTLEMWTKGEVEAHPQDEDGATYTKLIKKEDGLLNLEDPAEENLRKVLAYSTWPGAYMNFRNKRGKEIRIVIKDAKVDKGEFIPMRVIPAGKKEMDWQDFLRGN